MSAAAATDFYAVLGLDKDCSDSELRNAYKKLALRWHPDRCSGKNEAKEKFQTIQEAYSVLSDPDKRLMYDFGVYNENDDDENAGMEDFLGELAEMMSKNTPTESGPESFEELQRLFVEMFQSDIDAEFGGGASGAGNGWNQGTSSSSHKRGSSAMNSGKAEFGEMDMGSGGFCYGVWSRNLHQTRRLHRHPPAPPPPPVLTNPAGVHLPQAAIVDSAPSSQPIKGEPTEAQASQAQSIPSKEAAAM